MPKKGGLVDDIKNSVKKSGSNKNKILYLKEGAKVRVRFLQELDDGVKVLFHDSFEKGINHPCQLLYDKDCESCEDDGLRHRDQFVWSVYNHDSKETELLMGAGNNFSPVPLLVGMYDAYGTILDRDYVITKTGSGTNTKYSVVPMDKVKFKNQKAKPYSESKTLDILDKAFPYESEEEEEDEAPRKRNNKAKGKNNKKYCKECDELIEECTCDDEEELDFNEMSLKELKKYAKDNDIDIEGLKKPTQIIAAIKESLEDDEDEDEEDYSDMDAKELYKLCKERGINAKPKKDEDYYINLLEKDDKNDDDDEDEDDDW